jgi:hypothetical protein
MTVVFIDAHKILEITQFCVPYVPHTSDFVGLERVLIIISTYLPFLLAGSVGKKQLL